MMDDTLICTLSLQHFHGWPLSSLQVNNTIPPFNESELHSGLKSRFLDHYVSWWKKLEGMLLLNWFWISFIPESAGLMENMTLFDLLASGFGHAIFHTWLWKKHIWRESNSDHAGFDCASWCKDLDLETIWQNLETWSSIHCQVFFVRPFWIQLW